MKNLSPALTGVGVLPLSCGLLPASVIAGLIITRTGRLRWAVWTGWGVTIVSTGLLYLLDQDIHTGAWISIFIAVGFGQGLILGPLVFAAQTIARARDVAQATAMYTFVRTFGMCLGVAIGGTVFQNLSSHYLGNDHLPPNITPNAEAYVTQLKNMPEHSEFRHSVLHAYARAFRGLFAVMTEFGGLMSLAIGKHTMDKEQESGHTLC